MERRHICQGEPKGPLSGDTFPPSMCDIEACLFLILPPPLSYLESHILSFFLAFPLVTPFFFFRECRWVFVMSQCLVPPLFTLSLQERALSFKMSLGAHHHHLESPACLIISRISMWACNEQNGMTALLNRRSGVSPFRTFLWSFFVS